MLLQLQCHICWSQISNLWNVVIMQLIGFIVEMKFDINIITSFCKTNQPMSSLPRNTSHYVNTRYITVGLIEVAGKVFV